MKDSGAAGGPSFSFRKKGLLAPPVLFLLLALASPVAAAPSDPAYVNVGPGANQAYWNSATSFTANWGRSDFGGSTTGNFYSYVLNQTPIAPDPAGGTSGQQGPSANPPAFITISPFPTLVD